MKLKINGITTDIELKNIPAVQLVLKAVLNNKDLKDRGGGLIYVHYPYIPQMGIPLLKGSNGNVIVASVFNDSDVWENNSIFYIIPQIGYEDPLPYFNIKAPVNQELTDKGLDGFSSDILGLTGYYQDIEDAYNGKGTSKSIKTNMTLNEWKILISLMGIPDRYIKIDSKDPYGNDSSSALFTLNNENDYIDRSDSIKHVILDKDSPISVSFKDSIPHFFYKG